MRIDAYSLAKAGLNEDEIKTIVNSNSEENQMQILRKYRFIHLAIEVPGEDASNEWQEPVSDEEYSKLK